MKTFRLLLALVGLLNGAPLAAQTMSGLRKSTPAGVPGTFYYLTEPGQQGVFTIDPYDRTSPDDSVLTLVTANGIRLKRIVEGKMLNVQWFGAVGKGSTDDAPAIQKGIDYILRSGYAPRTLYFPPGLYRIDHPLLLARPTGKGYAQTSITLEGPAGSKDLGMGSATIAPNFENSFAIGVQLGKGVLIKDLIIRGKFTLPNKLNMVQVDTLSFREWDDGIARNNSFSPYAGVVIDPFSDSTIFGSNSDLYPGLHSYYPAGMSRSGSTDVRLEECSISNFIVGVMITPSNQQNGDLINVIDCDISNNKVGYAMGQAQSKECHVDRLKCWGNTHTLFDNITYGIRHGDGAAVPMVDGVNIAGSLKQLCAITAGSFNGVFRNVYGEGLFRLGLVNGAATLAFEDCQLNFTPNHPGLPYPDFMLIGNAASFHGCMLRHYTGARGMRLVLSGTDDRFDNGVMNEPPVAAALGNCGNCPTPHFNNVVMYYSNGILGSGNNGITTSAGLVFFQANGMGAAEPVYPGNTYLFRNPYSGADLLYKFSYDNTYERTVELSGTPIIHVDKSKWTAWFKLDKSTESNLLMPGDIIVTAGMHCQDQFTSLIADAYPVGYIESIDHDIVHLRNLAYGIQEGMKLSLIMDYYVYENSPFTGDMAAGSNTLTNVQGLLPAAGDRLDMPMLPSGTYVTVIDTSAKTVRFSNANNTGRSFDDFTVLNGYPHVEMHSTADLPALQRLHKALIGGSDFFLYPSMGKIAPDPAWLLGPGYYARYRNINTLIMGDTSLHKLKYNPVNY
jgi:hypothetical protein